MAWLVCVPVAHAQVPRLEISPPQVEMCAIINRATPFPVMVSLTNGSALKLDGVAFDARTETGLEITGLTPASLGSGEGVLWDAQLGRRKGAASINSGSIYIRATRTDSKGERRLVATATLEVKPSAVAIASIATLTIKGPSNEITEKHGGAATVTVANLSPFELGVTLALPSTELRFVEASFNDDPWQKEQTKHKQIPPLGVISVPVSLAEKQIGKESLVVSADITWNDGGCDRNGALTATFDAATASPEISSLLAAVGVPTLLLLPGFLFLATCGVLWKLGLRIGKSEGDFPLSVASAEFWVPAIVLSFAALKIYGLFHLDLLDTYQLGAVMRLWMASIVAAIGLYLTTYAVVRHIKNVRERAAQEAERQSAAAVEARTPKEQDDPLTTLDKLARRGQDQRLRMVKLKGDPKLVAWYRLTEPDGTGSVWISPQITYQGGEYDAQILALRSKRDLAGLITLFRTKSIPLQWAMLGGPRRAKNGELVDLTEEELIAPQVDEE